MTQGKEIKILLVDDDAAILETLKLLLDDTFSTLTASSGKEAIELVQKHSDIAAAVMDIRMPEMNGIQAARVIREINEDIAVIFHTGYPGNYNQDEINESEKPFEYIEKGESVSRLMRAVNNAAEFYIMKNRKYNITGDNGAFGIIGQTPDMKNVFLTIAKVAPTDSKVMILGETGTGKELVAQAIHKNSLRKDQKMAIFNCNHRSPDLVESELFGHGKGAFTGAIEDRVGLFEYANGGTVFLDEIGDLDITTQAKILRVLESGEFQTLGKTPELKKANVRIICATHHDLEKLISINKFRQDLYYRLKGIKIKLPALRDKKEDIPLLVTTFADNFTIEADRSPVHFDNSAINVLMNYDWPGNVRQLRDTVESLITLSQSDIIIGNDAKSFLGNDGEESDDDYRELSLSDRLRDFRKNCILEALNKTDFNVSKAARILRVDPSNLRKFMKAHGIK
jgi:two-component system nitrogen regulation response regulator NtrX